VDQASTLALGRNPFAPTRNPADRIPNRGFERALAEVLSCVGRGERLIALFGAPGTGKTLLLEAARRALEGRIPVRNIARGDLLAAALNEAPATLLVDEGERADASTLARLTGGGWPAPVVIAFARPPAGLAYGHVVRLRPLSSHDARAHIVGRLARTGRQRLFSRAALDTVIGAAEGNPRTLSLIAGSALFAAQSADAPEVDADHVRSAIAMRGRLHAVQPKKAARTWQWPVGQPAWLARDNRTAIAAAVGLVVVVSASVTWFVAPPPPHHGSTPRATVPVAIADPPAVRPRLSPAIQSVSISVPVPVPVPVPVRVPVPVPEPVELARTTTLRSPRHNKMESTGTALSVSVASIAVAKHHPHTPGIASSPPPISPAHRLPAIVPSYPPPSPVVAAIPSSSRPETFALNAGRPTPTSSTPAPPSPAALIGSATAREDARAAREAAMEARDAMQIMRTARER